MIEYTGQGRLRRLSDDQCGRIYAACLTILERTGVRMHDPQAVALMRQGGARVADADRVRIPPEMVERARSTAPSTVTLYDRAGRPVMEVGGYRCFFGPGSDCLYIRDHRTGQRRRALLGDVQEAMRIADALPNIDFIMCMFLPHDVPQLQADRFQMEAMLRHSAKPVIFVTTELSGCVDAIAMAEAVRGGPEALREQPLAGCYINVTTGLNHNEEALQKLLYLSGKGLPFAYVPSTQGGVTAPVTPAGALAVSQAGALAGLVLAQLNNPGSPFIMPGWGGNMLDMRTTVQPYADPDKRALAADFVHWLGLPMFGLAGCSDSKMVDQQAGIESALTLMTDVLCGANLIHDLGYLESGMTGSIAQLVIMNEVLGWLDHFAADPRIDDETLALDLVDAVGPDGQFLDSDHTFNHFQDRWYPGLFDRQNFDGWQAAGGGPLLESAAEEVERILEQHRPPGLGDAESAALLSIRERALQ